VYSPLAKGMLTDRYLGGIPDDSRGARPHGAIRAAQLEEVLPRTRQLVPLAQARGQTLAQMAIAWVLRWPQVTSALIGASRLSQIEDVLGALKNLQFSPEELARIDAIFPVPAT
jgi:L-glyceraldehyde 3-phosphate reductase